MNNNLTIKKQSNLNDLVKLVGKFVNELNGEIYDIGREEDDYTPYCSGKYNGENVVFTLENDDELQMSTDLGIDDTYNLYKKLMRGEE